MSEGMSRSNGAGGAGAQGLYEQLAQGGVGLDSKLLCSLESPGYAEAGDAEVCGYGRRGQSVAAHGQETDDVTRVDGSRSVAVADDLSGGKIELLKGCIGDDGANRAEVCAGK
jgi:hypothetical protein